MEYEGDGRFWLQRAPENRVRGRLTFDQEDAGDLRLEDLLLTEGPVNRDEPEIPGQALDGTPLCCLDTFPSNITIQIPERGEVYPHRQFVNFLLVGTSDRRHPVSVVREEMEGLLEFVGFSGLAVESQDSRPDKPVTVTWAPPTENPKATVDGIEVEIVSEHKFSGSETEFVLEHCPELEVRGKARSIEEWSKIADQIEGFIGFLLGYAVWSERFYAPGEERDIDLLFRQRDRISHKGDRPPWLQLEHLGDRFETALRGWFAFRKSDKEAHDLLNEYVRFGDDRLHPDQLLDLARIIELYHRGAGRYEQLVVKKNEHQARVKKLAAAVPDEDRSWLKDKLARANDKTLRQKIVELVEDLGVAVEPVIEGTIEEFAAEATNNRNYYTHYSSYYKEAGKVAEGMDLYTLVQRLVVVVRACVLRELGFENEEIAQLLWRSRWYRNTAATLAQKEAAANKAGQPAGG